MKKYIFLFGVILIAFILSSTTTKNEKSGETIKIEHKSSVNKKETRTIEINVNKLQEHLEHGDSIVSS